MYGDRDSVAVQDMRGNRNLRLGPGEIDTEATYEVILAGSKGGIQHGNLKLGTGILNSQSGNIYLDREIFGHKLSSFIIEGTYLYEL